jgi:hypothetical protein
MGLQRKTTLVQARTAAVSGKWSVAFLVLCFAVSGVLLPVAAHLPRWVEFEMVLGAWWLVWACAIGWLLYRGCDVADDMPYPHAPKLGRSGLSDVGLDGCLSLDLGVEGCGAVVLVVVAVLLLIVGIWFAVEFLIPGLAFLLYLLVRGMAARAVNDRRDCKTSVLRAVSWGIAWATLYTAPLALTVLAVHAIHPHLHHG